ncbi:Integrase catalytic domain-containing protein, partial [Aphis craccivora]
DVRNKIGNTDSIRRTIRRARRKNVPEEPIGKWKTTMGGESKEFLIYDSESENRMLIFATSRALTILSSASLWFMDGTFKCSSVFAQLYVIRAEFEDNVFTYVYAFLPNKLQTTYEEMLTNFGAFSLFIE